MRQNRVIAIVSGSVLCLALIGPWLLVDLPAGTYTVTALRDGQDQIKGQVTAAKGGVKTLHLRWKNGTQ